MRTTLILLPSLLLAQNYVGFQSDTRSSQLANFTALPAKNLVALYAPHSISQNLIPNSEVFASGWTLAGNGPAAPTVTANAAVAPDGTLTAARVDYPAVLNSGEYSLIYKTVNIPAAPLTVSVWVRAVSGTATVYPSFYSGTYNSHACSVTTVWQRCSFSFTPGGTVTFEFFGVDLRTGTGDTAQTAQSIYVWGFQAEHSPPAGAPALYNKTATGSVVRDLSGHGLDLVDGGMSNSIYSGTGYGIASGGADGAGVSSASFPTGSTDLTMMFLTNRSTISGLTLLASYGDPGVGSNAVLAPGMLNSGSIPIEIFTGGGGGTATALPFPVVPSLLTIRYTNSSKSLKVTINDDIAGQYSTTLGTAITFPSPSKFMFGWLGSGFPCINCNTQLAAIWSRAFSDQELRELFNRVRQINRQQSSGALIFLGDSLTFGNGISTEQGGATAQQYPAQTFDALAPYGPPWAFNNLGINGQTAATIDTNFNGLVPVAGTKVAARNVVVVLAGINDLLASTTPANVYISLKSIWSKARTAGFKVVAATLTPAATETDSTTQALNTLIKSDSTLYDALADFRADANLGNPTCSGGNTWYQSDCIHWTAAGTKVAAGIAAAAILSPPIQMTQLWSGVLSASRAMNWSGAGVVGGIPSYPACTSGQAGVTVPVAAYGSSGTPASPSTINTALSNCAAANPSGSVLQLAAGTFYLNAGVDFSGLNKVALSGQGADQSFLNFSGNTGCGGPDTFVCIAPPTAAPDFEGNVCDWTAGYSQGATTISLSNCGTTTPASGSLSNLKIGSILTLDQVDTKNDPGVNIWVCTAGIGASVQCQQEGNGGTSRKNGPTVNGIADRSQQQVVRVTNCANNAGVCTSGSNITISPGLYMSNWSSGLAPQGWYGSSFTVGNGLQNLSVSNSDSSTFHADQNIVIGGCYGCWQKGVRSLYAQRSHTKLVRSSHITVQDSYEAFSLTHGTQSYGMEIDWMCDSLVQNNIWQQVTGAAPTTVGVGNVIAYNFGILNVSSAGFAQASDYFHAGGDSYNLLEGNIGFGENADNVHGTHSLTTAYRNFFPGWQDTCNGIPCTAQTNPLILTVGSRGFNFIANVIGTPGYHTQYQSVASSGGTGSNCAVSVYSLNYSATGCSPDTSINGYCTNPPTCTSLGAWDPQTSSMLMRWGNWDPVNAATQWNSGEVPSGIANYANPVPTTSCTSSIGCPSSFFLASKPSWWGALKWPGIGPDVTGGNVGQCSGGTYNLVPGNLSSDCTGGSLTSAWAGHANMNPAMQCAIRTMGMPIDGSGSALSFNASACY